MNLIAVSTYNETEILLRLADGDQQAFETLYNYYYLPVFRFAKKFVKEQNAAEDITTEIFIKLWNKRSDFDHSLKVQSFLFTATKNSCLNWIRSQRRQDQREQAFEKALAEEQESDFVQPELTERLYRYLYEEIEKLPEKMQKILKLHLDGYKNDEIAEELRIAEKTVRNLKVEAIKLLKVSLLKRDLAVWALVIWHFLRDNH